MLASAIINGKKVRTMLDTGTKHNFIDEGESKQLSLKITSGRGSLKVVTSPVKLITSMAKSIQVHLGEWSESIDFSIVSINDFQMVLELVFFNQVTLLN